jgi:RNA polymerase sigma factor (sigma-70 family)
VATWAIRLHCFALAATSSEDISWWLGNIGREPLLTRREVIELSRLYQQGLLPDATRSQQRAGARAKDRLIKGNLRLVVAVARKYRTKATTGAGFLDLLQEGSIGLIRAVELYDITRGYAFATYAYSWIKQGITKSISHHGRTVRIPSGLLDSMRKVRRATAAFQQEHNRQPTMDQLVELTGLRQVIIERGIAAEFVVISADVMLRPGDDSGTSLGETLAAPMPDEDDSEDVPWRLEWAEGALSRPGAHSTAEIDSFLSMLAGVPVSDTPVPGTTEAWRRRRVVRDLHEQAVADGLAEPVEDAWVLARPTARRAVMPSAV